MKENVAPPEPDTTSTTCLTPYPITNGVASVPEVTVSAGAEQVECDTTTYYPAEEGEEVAEEGGTMDDWVTEFDP